MHTTSPTHPLRGVTLVLLAAALWGTTGTAQSFAPAQLSSYWIGALRLVVAALCFGLLLRPQGAKGETAGPEPGTPGNTVQQWTGVGAAALCMGAYNLAFFAGLRDCGVAAGTALALGSGPVWAGLLQIALTRRLPPPSWWAGTAVAVGGVALLSGSGRTVANEVPLRGVLLCLLAGLSYAVYAQINHRLVSQMRPAALSATVFTLAALIAVAGAWVLSESPTLRIQDVGVLLWLGVASTAVAYWLFTLALRHISAATAVVLALAEPVVAFVLAVVVVGERPGWTGVMGLMAVLLGLWGVIRSEQARSPTSSPTGSSASVTRHPKGPGTGLPPS